MKTLLIFAAQILLTFQENFDEDISFALPVTIYYRTANVFSPDQVQNIDNNNNCTCKFLAGLDTHCSGSSCKTFPSQINTTAILFKLKLTSIQTLFKDDFILLGNVLGMDINANVKLEKIEAGCFRKMNNLKNLSLVANVNLKHLDEKVFEGLINVEQMYFQKNGFNHVIDITRSLSTKFVPKLQLLDMSESIFRNVKHYDFFPMKGSKLIQLNLILCELEYVHSDCLLPLKNLNILLLGQNIFNISSLTHLIQNTTRAGIKINYLSLYDIGLRKTIPDQLIQAIAQSNITTLSLANNHFDYIYDSDFPFMPNLNDLDLRSNFIEDIAENAFTKLPALKYLRLGENKLFSVPKGALVEQITYLDLAGNTIEGIYFSMQDGVFSKMVNLRSLQLSYNSIFALTNQSFVGLTNLLKLNLKRSDLNHIEEGSFMHLKNLQQLNLMENPLNTVSLTAEVFKGLENLEVLLLSGCSIKNLTITPNIFTYMPNLTYLGLEKTDLYTISSNQFTNLNRLHTLNLADNKLAAWSKPILSLPELKILYAQQNKISYVTDVMLDDWRNLEKLYLDGNPFSCDCSLYSVVLYLKSKEITLNNIVESEEYVIAKCIFPETWRQKSVVDFLKHLSNNESDCKNYNIVEIVSVSIFIILAILIISCILFCIYKRYVRKLFSDRLYKCHI